MKKYPYFMMSWVPADECSPSILLRIEKPYVKFFLEELFFSVNQFETKTKMGKFHFKDDAGKGEEFLFGFNVFGFSNCRAWFSKKFLYISIKLSSVGIKDISLTLSVVFKTMERVIKKYSCTEFSCLNFFDIESTRKNKMHGFTCLGKTKLIQEVPVERGQRLLLPAIISRGVLKAMIDAWKALFAGSVHIPIIDAGVYSSGDFMFSCPMYKAENMIVSVGADGKLHKITFDVTKDIQQIVLYCALVKFSEMIYRDVRDRIKKIT